MGVTKNVGDIRSFLGLAGYYRRFIENFAKIAKPMKELLKKEKKFLWTEACEASFQELKKRLVTAPVLCLPDIQKDFQVYCDASRQGLGSVLMQDGKVVSYAPGNLRTMNTTTPHMIWNMCLWFMHSRYGDTTSWANIVMCSHITRV